MKTRSNNYLSALVVSSAIAVAAASPLSASANSCQAAQLASQVAMAGGGDSSKGGGYDDYQADLVLKAAKKWVIRVLTNTAYPLFKRHADYRQKAISGLTRICLAPFGEESAPNGRKRMFSYDLKTTQIIVLKPFFERFGKELSVKQEAVNFTSYYLLREVAHFWNNGDDDDSDEFADRVVNARTLYEIATMTDVAPKLELYVKELRENPGVSQARAAEILTELRPWVNQINAGEPLFYVDEARNAVRTLDGLLGTLTKIGPNAFSAPYYYHGILSVDNWITEIANQVAAMQVIIAQYE